MARNNEGLPGGFHYEWGVKYIDLDNQVQEKWGYTSDPRMSGPHDEPVIDEDNTIWIGDDGGQAIAVSRRPVGTHEWIPLQP